MLAKKLYAMLRATVDDWLEDRVSRMGAALAYYGVFSVAPLLLIAIAITGAVFGEQAARRELYSELAGLVGTPAAEAIEDIVKNVHSSGGSVLGSVIGVVVLLFGASGVFAELQDALNTIWKVKPQPGQGLWGVIRGRLFSFVVVLGTGFLLLASLVASAVLQRIQTGLPEDLAGNGWLWWGLNLLLSFGLETVLFAVLYKVLPDTMVGWRDVWPGAVIAALLFALGKYLIALYLTRGAVVSAFGAAGSVIVVLTWVYYSSQILLFGAEFTRVYALQAGSEIRPAADAMSLSGEERARQGLVCAENRQPKSPTATRDAPTATGVRLSGSELNLERN